MSETVIKVENLSKQYRLGSIGTGTLRSDFQRYWANLIGKEDPTLKIGEENTLDNNHPLSTNNEYVWALNDINFEVKQGEVLGFIGKNGAGKSTLLKILSQVTTPTIGHVKIKGRIASLLEVGTGFHPELTGRENIFLNGAILGMTKPEIRKKFDEIVDFAGVAKYIDTPVKRYSSGMYVRLAFAVAAHLDPEILIVDEVLAVGDSEFQEKCLGKMKDVSIHEGRSVLFVSHQMSAIKSLCQKVIYLKNGKINEIGEPLTVIDNYIHQTKTYDKFGVIPTDIKRNDWLKNIAYFKEIWLKNSKGEFSNYIKYLEPVEIDFLIECNEPVSKATLFISIGNTENELITYSTPNSQITNNYFNLKKGNNHITIRIDQSLLPGKYFVNSSIFNPEGFPYDGITRFGEFTVSNLGIEENYPWTKSLGFVHTKSELINIK